MSIWVNGTSSKREYLHGLLTTGTLCCQSAELQSFHQFLLRIVLDCRLAGHICSVCQHPCREMVIAPLMQILLLWLLEIINRENTPLVSKLGLNGYSWISYSCFFRGEECWNWKWLMKNWWQKRNCWADLDDKSNRREWDSYLQREVGQPKSILGFRQLGEIWKFAFLYCSEMETEMS